jgi:hypothetical protein
VKTRAEVEEWEEKAGKAARRPWLGQLFAYVNGGVDEQVWEVTPEALGPALAYVLSGLLKSGHVVVTQHNRFVE